MWREFQTGLEVIVDGQFKVAGDGDYNVLSIDNGYLESSEQYKSILSMDAFSLDDVRLMRDALSAYLKSFDK